MKYRRVLSILLLIISIGTKTEAQDIQFLYDFGEMRQMPVTMIQKYHTDNLGDTFFFVSMGYKAENSGMSLAYWEISRTLLIDDFPLQPRVEYNGGFYSYDSTAYTVNNAWLLGIEKKWHNNDFSKFIIVSLNYKYIKAVTDRSFQITGTWGVDLWNRKVSLVGYADLWYQPVTMYSSSGNLKSSKWVFVSEPQILYNINRSFSIVGEVELNYFYDAPGFYICPAMGISWRVAP